MTQSSLRRRLRLVCSSDEEEDNNPQFPNPNPNSTPNASEPVLASVMAPEPVTISDDDDAIFLDVPDFFPPPPPSAASPPETTPFGEVVPPENSSGAAGGCPVGGVLLKRGLKLKREWLESCLRELERNVPGFSALNDEGKAKLCFAQFLYTDMNRCGGGVLPPNVGSMHLVDLPGPFVLQVDEIVNISCPLRGRYQNNPSGIKRCLKLSMTDGSQCVYGMEYRPIKDLQVFSPAGMKVIICNVHIRHGILMLVPEAFEVLGGSVEEFEAARRRLVEEVNKPPRGRRTKNGVVPPLATRATLAAWPPDGANHLRHTSNSMPQTTVPSLASGQGASVGGSLRNGGNFTTEAVRLSRSGENLMSTVSEDMIMDVEEMQIDVVPRGNRNVRPERNMEDVNCHSRGQTVVSNVSSNVASGREIREGEFTVSNENPSSAATPDAVMIDDNEHPLILSGDREIPFTYLASLSAKWAAIKDRETFVQGKVKCLLTGVKGFQYKQRTAYDLRVYVDDGSLISEILIDHSVVLKGIGHSPEEVTAALSSSDRQVVNSMKETLRQFQILLANFEGTMLVEMNRTSPLPIALEMNQGCVASDAWLLLRRLKSSTSPQTPQHPRLNDPIDISP